MRKSPHPGRTASSRRRQPTSRQELTIFLGSVGVLAALLLMVAVVAIWGPDIEHALHVVWDATSGHFRGGLGG